MSSETVTYANSLGEFFAPFLLAVRATGFFEAYVFLPIAAVLSALVFRYIYKKLATNGTFNLPIRQRFRRIILPLYFLMCFFFVGGLIIAFKTMIIEEMDYTEPHWYIPYVTHLHFYIASVALAYMYLMRFNSSSLLTRLLCVYIQIGFIGAYMISAYRIIYEPWELSDPTSGLSGFYVAAFFVILNIELFFRFIKPYDRSVVVINQTEKGKYNV